MNDLTENKLFYRGLLVCYAVLVIAALEMFPPLSDLLQLTEFPSAADMQFAAAAFDVDSIPNANVSLIESLMSYVEAVDFPIFICGLMAVDTFLVFMVERRIVRMFEG